MDIKIDGKVTIVFDLDDTLYYELDYLISAYKEIAVFIDARQYKVLFSIMFSMYRNKLDVFSFLEEKYGVEKQILIKKYRTHKPTIYLNEGVLKVLKRIKEKGGKIAIITDGRKKTQKNKIKALQIGGYVDFISISEEIGYEKPNKTPFKNVMDRFKSEEFYYIADNFKKDFIAPNELNWNSIGLIDLGKNIHSNSHLFLNKKYIPKNLIYSFCEINII